MNQLGFGGAALTSISSYRQIKRLLNTAIEMGINHFDTAPLYGKGYSEYIFGEILKPHRKNITITTKFGLGNSSELKRIPLELLLPLNSCIKKIKAIFPRPAQQLIYFQDRKIEKKEIEVSFKASLKRLQTDYLDYYLLHEAVPGFMTDEALEYIRSLKQQGKVRYIGIGADSLKLIKMEPQSATGWDILQYDGSVDETKNELMQKFPNHVHFHHSCLRSLKSSELTGGHILAKAASLNSKGKIIFSTRNIIRLKDNITQFYNYFK